MTALGAWPSPGEELLLRSAGAWPPDAQGYLRDPASRELRHWTMMLTMLRRDARRGDGELGLVGLLGDATLVVEGVDATVTCPDEDTLTRVVRSLPGATVEGLVVRTGLVELVCASAWPTERVDPRAAAREEYESFIRAKVAAAPERGFEPPLPVSEVLFPFQRDIVRWAVRRGRAAIFASFGLGKTFMQLEIARQVCAQTGGRFLIVAPLGVRGEFKRDAEKLGVELTFIRRVEEAGPTGVYLTNYEPVRDGKLDPRLFDGASLDEASCLRGFGGTKTFREFMALFAGDDRRDMSQRVVGEQVQYRFVATATPSPNEFIELLAYSAFLGVLEVSGAKTRFFQRDYEHADNLTLHPHKEREFWMWMASWATFVTRPSDVDSTYSDDGYDLPPMEVVWHEIPTDHARRAGEEKARKGQVAVQRKMFADAAEGVTDAAREARASLPDRVAKLLELRAAAPEAHRVIWHDLEAEREAIERAIPSVKSVYGSQDLDEREVIIEEFSEGRVSELAAKPVMLGSGCNFQHHCAEAVFLGVGYKFNDFIQAVHRIVRFGQSRPVTIHVIYTEAQREIRRALEAKWSQHRELVSQMTAIVQRYGLSNVGAHEACQDKLTCERREASGDGWRLILNDCIDETRSMPDGSVGLILTSIPFSMQYKYSDSYRDFGHTDTNEHFFRQMDYLTPELLRVLQPGRIAAIHVKDRVVPGGMNGMGFQTIYPFHAECISHYTRHGFAYMGMITVVTDVVRENAQTYRLGWTEQCKDGTKQGVGMPEYILLFRRPPTSNESAAADVPVAKSKGTYTRGRWQVDAHAFHRSSGNRLLTPDDLVGLEASEVFQRFARWSLESVYDHETHVALCDALDAKGKLPPSFMLLQPQSHHEDVWSDVARMRTMNTLQAAQDRVQHLCPMQFDIADRIITRFTMKDETVFDPFSGLGTVAYCAVKLGRKGLGTELSPVYFAESVRYLRAAERQRAVPTLFDLDALGSPERETCSNLPPRPESTSPQAPAAPPPWSADPAVGTPLAPVPTEAAPEPPAPKATKARSPRSTAEKPARASRAPKLEAVSPIHVDDPAPAGPLFGGAEG